MAKIATTNAADWQAVIERLEAEQAELLAQAATVRAGKGAHALAAATGDATAKKALASADAEAARLATDAENLSLALQEARQRLISAEAGEKGARAAELYRLSELRRLAIARQRVAEKVEAALGGFVEALIELQTNSGAVDALLDDNDRAAVNSNWRWHWQIGALLLRDAEAAGIRLDLDRPHPADDGESVESVTSLAAATWTDAELQDFANATARV